MPEKLNYSLLHYLLQFVNNIKEIFLLRGASKYLHSTVSAIIENEKLDDVYLEYSCEGAKVFSLVDVIKIKTQLADVASMKKFISTQHPITTISEYLFNRMAWEGPAQGYMTKRSQLLKLKARKNFKCCEGDEECFPDF